jgi:hypothetical protein
MFTDGYIEYYLAIKNEILSFAAKWIELEDIVLNENKPSTERQIMYHLTHIWKLKQLI